MKGHTRCPICGRPVDLATNRHRPFCSRRCKMVDLGSWFKEDYKIVGEDLDHSPELPHQIDQSKKE